MRAFIFCLLLISQSFIYSEVISCDNEAALKQIDLKKANIESITFPGVTYFSSKELEKIVSHPQGPLDWLQLMHDAGEIKKSYQAKGFFETDVTLCLQKTSVHYFYVANFKIDEKKRAHIRQINVRGNEHVSPQYLTHNFFHQAGNYFNQDQLNADKNKLLSEYHRRGFLDAQVIGVQMKVSADYQEISLVFEVKEGNVYSFGGIDFTGDLPEDVSQWKGQISLKKGDVLNILKLHEEADGFLNSYREQGYVLAQIKPQVQLIKATSFNTPDSVFVTYQVTKGPIIHVRQFEIKGNYFTKSHVIEREIETRADRVCRLQDLHLLKDRLMALGYFNSVQVLLKKTDIFDLVDVLIQVEEKPAWAFSILPMVISDEGFVVSGIWAHRNWLGDGFLLSLSARLSAVAQLFDFVFLDPRIFDTRHSLLFDMHRRQLQYPIFRAKSTGFSLWHIASLGQYFKINSKIRFDLVDVDELKNPQVGQIAFVPHNHWRNTLELVLAFDFAKSIFSIHGDISGSYAGSFTLSQLQFLKAGASLQISAYLFKIVKIKGRFQTNALFPVEKSLLPLSERYFLGGQGSIRGYRPRSIGPEFGGVLEYLQSLEVEFPVWPRRDFMGYVFADAGNVFLADALHLDGKLYWSLGAGVALNVLQLPLRFEISVPLSKSANGIPFDVFMGAASDW